VLTTAFHHKQQSKSFPFGFFHSLTERKSSLSALQARRNLKRNMSGFCKSHTSKFSVIDLEANRQTVHSAPVASAPAATAKVAKAVTAPAQPQVDVESLILSTLAADSTFLLIEMIIFTQRNNILFRCD
jgi:hypothetical protein